MDLELLYADIMNRGKNKILLSEEATDKTIDDSKDSRMGLTLVIRPPYELQERMCTVINELEDIEPEQYFYPAEDFHITLFDIITARQGFRYTEEQKNSCSRLAKSVLSQADSFRISLNGVIVSESCIMVKGFYEDEMERIRQQLRKQITQFGLVLDERYPTASAHITIGRFRKPLVSRRRLIAKIEELGQYDFGSFQVSQIELVCHNWFDSKKEIIECYSLVGNCETDKPYKFHAQDMHFAKKKV